MEAVKGLWVGISALRVREGGTAVSVMDSVMDERVVEAWIGRLRGLDTG